MLLRRIVPTSVLNIYRCYKLSKHNNENVVGKKNQVVLERLRLRPEPIKLELGAGSCKGQNGWTTIDLFGPECDLNLDLLRPLPFDDDSVAEIYSSHFLVQQQMKCAA